MIRDFKGGEYMRNKIILVLGLLLAWPVTAGVLIYNLRVYDSSADPTAIIPKYYVADTFAELPVGLQGDYAYAKDTDKFYYYTGAAWILVSDLSAEPFVTSVASGNLSAERVLTAGTNTTIDTGTAGQIKTNVTAAGSNTQVQFNNAGVLGGDANFVWDSAAQSLNVSSAVPGAAYPFNAARTINAEYSITVQNPDTGTLAHANFHATTDTANVAVRAHGSGRVSSQCGAALGGFNDLVAVSGTGLNICTLSTLPLYFTPGNARRAGILGTNGLFFLVDSGAKPTCDSAAAGGIWFDTGTPDTYEACTKDSGSVYAWRDMIATGGGGGGLSYAQVAAAALAGF